MAKEVIGLIGRWEDFEGSAIASGNVA